MKNVLTMTENNDVQIISIYEKFLNEVSGKKTSKVKPSKEMGYLSSVSDAKKLLEKLYNQKILKPIFSKLHRVIIVIRSNVVNT